jgi:EAL domain-containing protein (putative c-di-GMP-specific phosphodiesterase class I)
VAEGVEDGATFLALLNMGCDLAQGYLIARPMEASAASEWIEAHFASSKNLSFLAM